MTLYLLFLEIQIYLLSHEHDKTEFWYKISQKILKYLISRVYLVCKNNNLREPGVGPKMWITRVR